MQRLIFIHGFGENESIFDKIAPSLGGNQLFINVWNELGNENRTELNVFGFSEELINKYQISENDVVIGHSMGGWIAYHIKHFVPCKVIQIASWIKKDRINSPIKKGKTIYWMVRNGLYLNSFQKWLFVKMNYKNAPSRAIFESTFQDLIDGNKENIVNQLRLMFEPVEPILVVPELRIHAKRDAVILFPNEGNIHVVVGDHFTLFTHPDEVIKPILAFLQK